MQSALLEAMAEGKVSIGQSHPLPPFFVIATQNPADHRAPIPAGIPARPLRRAPLPRFSDPGGGAAAAARGQSDQPLERQLDAADLAALQAEAAQIHLSDASLDYLLALVQQSRFDAELPQPLSPAPPRPCWR